MFAGAQRTIRYPALPANWVKQHTELGSLHLSDSGNQMESPRPAKPDSIFRHILPA